MPCCSSSVPLVTRGAVDSSGSRLAELEQDAAGRLRVKEADLLAAGPRARDLVDQREARVRDRLQRRAAVADPQGDVVQPRAALFSRRVEVAHGALEHALVSLVDLLDRNDLDIGSDAVLIAEAFLKLGKKTGYQLLMDQAMKRIKLPG